MLLPDFSERFVGGEFASLHASTVIATVRISVSFRLPVNDNNICVFPLEPPSFVQRLKDMSCIVGSEISMTCMLSGSLPMTLSWIKDDRELTEDEHFKMSCETKSAMLNLKNAQLSHGGKYVCQAQNKAGTQRCAAVLIVTGLYDVRGNRPLLPLCRACRFICRMQRSDQSCL